MNAIRRTVVLGMFLFATGCGGPLGGLPLTLLGLPFEGPDDFFDFAFNTQAIPTSIPPGVYTGNVVLTTTLRVGDDEQSTETDTSPVRREFGEEGAPLDRDSNAITSGVFLLENGVMMEFRNSIPIDHPLVEPFDLPVLLTETMTLNSDGTLDYSGVASGATADGFVQLRSEANGTLSK